MPLRNRSSSLIFVEAFIILVAVFFQCRSSPTLIYFNTSYSRNSYSNTFLFLSNVTSSLLHLIVMHPKFKSFPSITSYNLLLQIFDHLAFYHYCVQSTSNNNSDAFLCISTDFRLYFQLYIGASSNCLTLQFFWI